MLNSSRSTHSLTEKDNRKAITERIHSTENHFGELCSVLSSFTKKSARLRDKHDEIGGVLKSFADSQEYNETLVDGLTNCAKAMTLLGDIKDIEVQRLQTKVTHFLAVKISTWLKLHPCR